MSHSAEKQLFVKEAGVGDVTKLRQETSLRNNSNKTKVVINSCIINTSIDSTIY